ncbi:MAG: TonB-dependent receptor [Cyclobacteriaceae bacterium]
MKNRFTALLLNEVQLRRTTACLLMIAMSVVLSFPVNAQSSISGQVTGADGFPIPGVSISVKGTTNGTITNAEGQYTLNVNDSDILVFTFIGFQSVEQPVNARQVIDVTLEEDLKELDEIVVIGYGTQRKEDITGSISRVDGEEMYLPSTSSFDQMLQGRVSGVQISQTSGAPGGNVNILIRGVSSITGGNQPLYVVDGYPISAGGSTDFSSYGGNMYSSDGITNNTQDRINPLASINPADIESIEVLKDASATAIYGSRGANGVVIITTKRGSTGKAKVSVDISYGVQNVANKLDMMNSAQYAEYVADGRDNARVYVGGSASDPNEVRSGAHFVRPEFRNPESITTNTDWQDVIYQAAPVSNYQVSASGGTQSIDYFVSTGFYQQEGIVKTSNYDRFNLRTNLDIHVTDRVKIGTSLSGSYGYGNFPNTEGHYGTGGVISQALAASPTIPVYNADGSYYNEQADVTDGLGWLQNPLALLDGFSDKRKNADIYTNNFLEISLLDGLTFRTSAGVQYSTSAIRIWRSSEIPRFTTLDYPSNAGATKSETLNWLNENTLNYKHIFADKHNLDVLVGFTAQKENFDRLSAGASDFPTDNVTYLSAGIVNAGTHINSEWAILSLLSRINYAYDGKYLFTGTVRRDGSSRFGGNNKWGTFPSFSLGYIISEESFMDGVSFISSLKLRGSYGHSGNNQIGNYSHIGLLRTANYVVNNSQAPGLVPSSLPNNDLTWEKSKQTNLGIDLSLFNQRISITTELYKNLKTDLLLGVELPASSGFFSSTQNIGDIENKGYELTLQTVNVQANKFEWNTSFTFSRNINRVLKIATEGGRITNSAYQITQVGSPIASFYMQNAIGVYRSDADVTGTPVIHPNVQGGDLIFEDVDGDGTINSNDRKIVGDPWPDYTWGLNNNFTYGNLSLSVALNGSHGAETYFQAGTMILNMAGVQNQLVLSDRRWRSESDPGDGFQPRAIRSNYANAFGTSSRFLFDASYVRIKNINLAYKLPAAIVSRMSLSNVSVYMNVANLHTFTDYPGYDPESTTSGNNVVNSGIDYLTYPLARTYTFGLNVTF